MGSNAITYERDIGALFADWEQRSGSITRKTRTYQINHQTDTFISDHFLKDHPIGKRPNTETCFRMELRFDGYYQRHNALFSVIQRNEQQWSAPIPCLI